ncbi:MAG: ribosome-associated translation inhibitor RaiA [Chloroflexota bacterium]|nr:ribosome-associated translation inhibitor RaiA [Chloroflexota bacterium]
MRTTIRGKNLTVSDKDRAYIERKMQRLERMLDDDSEAEVDLRLEGNRKVDDSHIVDVSLTAAGQSLRGVGEASSFRVAADEVIDKIERRVVEARQRPRDRRRAEQARYADTIMPTEPVDGPDEADEESRVVKIKRFAIEPMFEEDAISRMEELGHTFFIFVNAENERIAVLYRRRDGRYGLIEPSIGGGYSGGE